MPNIISTESKKQLKLFRKISDYVNYGASNAERALVPITLYFVLALVGASASAYYKLLSHDEVLIAYIGFMVVGFIIYKIAAHTGKSGDEFALAIIAKYPLNTEESKNNYKDLQSKLQQETIHSALHEWVGKERDILIKTLNMKNLDNFKNKSLSEALTRKI